MDLRQTLRPIARATAIVMLSGSAGVMLTLMLFTAVATDPFPFQHHPFSETSATALAAEPTPAYVSELAPALALAPRTPAALPASGAGDGPRGAAVNIIGLGLALCGAALVRAALVFRAT